MTADPPTWQEQDWLRAEHMWKTIILPDWEGHPWATAEHHTVGHHRASCACGTWCYPSHGCWCCNEPAHEWLTAEARWEASFCRGAWAEASMQARQPTLDGVADCQNLHPFPWDLSGG